MADPGATIPYFDIYDGPFLDDLQNMTSNEPANPSLLDHLSPADAGQLSNIPHSSASLPPPDHDQYVTHDQNRVSDPNNDLLAQNPDSWILCESTFDGAGTSSSHQAGLINQGIINNDYQQFHQENVEFPAQNDFSTGHAHENTTPLPTWLLSINCRFCQVLRELIHINNEYNHQLKLEIHGRIGLISHAILQRTSAYENNNTSGDCQYEMLDFRKKSNEGVKQFLTQYCYQRKQEGYVILMNDPLSIFYEALSIGLAWREILVNNDHFVDEQNPRVNTTFNSVVLPVGANQMEQPPEQQGQLVVQQHEQEANQPPAVAQNELQSNRRLISLAEQRQRTVKMTLMDLQGVLHLPMDEAAKCLNVCPTVVKKICRKHNLQRWPFRKIKSIKGKIEKLKPRLDSTNEETRAHAQAEINRLREEAANACGGISIL